MDWVGLANAAQNVAFPIIVCIYLFFQNDKLRTTVDELKDVIRDNTTSLNTLKDFMLQYIKENERSNK